MPASSQALAHPAGARFDAQRALVARAFRDGRTRTTSFAALFALYAYVQPAGFRHAYPTLADRVAFAHSFAGNDALRLFYGYPFAVDSVGGYSAWRVGGTLAIAAAVYGILAAVRALRAEEEAGRTELVLAGCVGRAANYRSALVAVGLGTLLLWSAQLVGFLAGGLDLAGSAYLALAVAAVIPVFVGIGALTCQLAPTRRVALELGVGVVGVSLILRVVADTAAGAGWLRWATPLGWAEQLRPFSGAQPVVLVLPLLASVALIAAAARIARNRDVGTGLLPGGDSAPPRLRLLGSPTLHALRSETGSLIAWAGSVGVFALVLGAVSSSISSAGISKPIRRELAKLGSGSIATPTGYLAFAFIFFVLALSLFACAQVNAARHEEARQRLETLFAMPVSRTRWFAGRLALATVTATLLGLLAGLMAWLGATAAGVAISLPRMLEAGANCLPAALLFGALAALAYALAPRATGAIGYCLVAVSFLWQLVGSLLSAPKRLLELTPFAHVGLIPTQSFRTGDAIAMLAIAMLVSTAATVAFARRDLIGE
jgi:ABC-2 type transport system permease protein